MAKHFGHLGRSESMSSLASISADGERKYKEHGGGGVLRIDISLKVAEGARKKKESGTINIYINEAKQLPIMFPYVKLYLSADGKNMKGTKQKTKTVKKTNNPIYTDRFVYHLNPTTEISGQNRLQITLWNDPSKLSKHECCGGMSFSLEELTRTKKGWFSVLPEADGRYSYQFLGDTVEIDPLMIPDPIPVPPSPKVARKNKEKTLPVPPKSSKKEKGAPPPMPEDPKSPPTDVDDVVAMADRFASRIGKPSPSMKRKEKPKPPSFVSPPPKSEKPTVPTPTHPPPSLLPEPDTVTSSTPHQASSVGNTTNTNTTNANANTNATTNGNATATNSTTTTATTNNNGDDDSYDNIGADFKVTPSETLQKNTHVSEPPTLKRSDSTGSLASLASVSAAHVVSADVIAGRLHVEITAAENTSTNSVSVKVIAGADLHVADPYVKLYLSKMNVDVKTSKRKTKSQRKPKFLEVAAPVFNEEFSYTVPVNFRSVENYRLQFSVWDHQRMKANSCAGGFSFSMDELFANKKISAWYDLLPFAEGRASSRPHNPTRSLQDTTDSDDDLPPMLHDDTHQISPIKAPKPSSTPQVATTTTTTSSTTTTTKPPSTTTAPSTSTTSTTLATTVAMRSVTKSDSTKSDRRKSTASQDSLLEDREMPASNLTRTNSMNSLVSVLSEQVTCNDVVEGSLHLYLFFEPAEEGKAKSNGQIQLTVNEGRGLKATDPYVKIYLSAKGHNIKNSKQKTEVFKKNKDPLFQKKFILKLPPSTAIDESTRLQIAVWDHSRSRANECTGAMSFSLPEIASTSRITGWYKLLPYKEGRTNNTVDDEPKSASPLVLRAKLGESDSKTKKSSGKATKSSLSTTSKPPPSSLTSSSSSTSSSVTKSNSASRTKSDQSKARRSVAGLLTSRKEDKNLSAKKSDSTSSNGKAQLEEKIEAYRQQVEQMAELQSRNLRLQADLADEQRKVELLEAEVHSLNDESENLTTEVEHLNDFITLHKHDADVIRDRLVVLETGFLDQTDENKALRRFVQRLQEALLKADPRAFAQVVSTQTMV